jgi:hypothetical protein
MDIKSVDASVFTATVNIASVIRISLPLMEGDAPSGSAIIRKKHGDTSLTWR